MMTFEIIFAEAFRKIKQILHRRGTKVRKIWHMIMNGFDDGGGKPLSNGGS